MPLEPLNKPPTTLADGHYVDADGDLFTAQGGRVFWANPSLEFDHPLYPVWELERHTRLHGPGRKAT